MKTTIDIFYPTGAGLMLALCFNTVSPPAIADDYTQADAQAAAAKGDSKAEYFLARQYEAGNGVARDDAKALQYLHQSAESGYATAQTALGSRYANGLGVKQDFTNAVEWYRKAAAQGEPLAGYCLGYAYANGKGVPMDMEAAINWWQKSAVQGQVYAQNALGQYYFQGQYPGDKSHINYDYAAKWLRQAAGQDYAPAMNTLGFLYERGYGVGQDWSEAAKWYRRAAEQGDSNAQDNLGQMYESGFGGLPRDIVQAYKWYLLSAKQRNNFGRHDAWVLETHNSITSEQSAEAKRLVAGFQAQTHTNQPAGNSN